MMNFRKFEALYELVKKEVALCAELTANEPVEEDWFVDAQAKITENFAALQAEFAVNFPLTLENARQHPGFTIGHFWELLEKYPELARQNPESFKAYLRSMEMHHAGIPAVIGRLLEE